jgi:hypothetical protein
MKKVSIFSDHWNILWPFGNLVAIWYISPCSGANPTIASYNASVVKIYSAVNSMARFQIKNYFSPI